MRGYRLENQRLPFSTKSTQSGRLQWAGTGTSASRNLYAEAAIRVRVVQSAPTIVCARGRPYCRCSDVVPLLDDRGFEEVIFLLNIHCLRHRDCRACTSSGKHSRPEIGDEAVEIWKMPSPALFAADSPYQRGVEGIFHAASPWRVFLDFWTMNPLSPKKKTPRCCNANFIAATGADTRDSRRASKSLTLAIGTSDNVAESLYCQILAKHGLSGIVLATSGFDL